MDKQFEMLADNENGMFKITNGGETIKTVENLSQLRRFIPAETTEFVILLTGDVMAGVGLLLKNWGGHLLSFFPDMLRIFLLSNPAM